MFFWISKKSIGIKLIAHNIAVCKCAYLLMYIYMYTYTDRRAYTYILTKV